MEASAVPYTILRATQFHDLALEALQFLDRLPVMLVPNGFPGQPIDSGEVADRLVELAAGAPAGRVPDVGGPEVRSITDLARVYLEFRSSRKRLLSFRVPGRTARAFRGGALTCPENRHDRIAWEEFLRRKPH